MTYFIILNELQLYVKYISQSYSLRDGHYPPLPPSYFPLYPSISTPPPPSSPKTY